MEGFTEMAHQVGGHATSLKSHNGRILKPFQSKQRGQREADFYNRVFVSEKDLSEFVELRKFLPGYYGTVEVEEGKESDELKSGKYLMLEDLTWGRQWPCIMDVKMGTKSYEEDATPEKIAYEKSKFPLQEKVGFRIQGIKVFDPKKKQYVEFDKHFGRAITSANELAPALRKYFPLEGKTKTIKLLEARLDQLKTWFNDQQGTEFIASSFLFLYDGEKSAKDDKGVAEIYAPDIRLIDFAHVTQCVSPKRDEGLRTGIATLIQCFQTILTEVQAE
ncbi:Inositol polyphosphate multikinase [Phytophthora citrophthora]|uniref:Kinase n=1 Tax=Phytophthora citrophthora TaxID=4793 RepID=A0AAD9GTZ6_9STRA|nr:Inositol polyphosphate multikinase [Phytophthora citrophthora]